MPIPDNTTRFVLSGQNGTGGEIWQVGFYEFGHTAGTFPDDAALASAMTSASWVALTTKLKPFWNPATKLLAADNYFLVGGVATMHAHAALNVVGTSTGTHPFQCSMVTTLRSSLASRSGRGRMYWPATGALMDSQGKYDVTQVNDIVDALATWFTALNSATPKCSVVSQTTSSVHTITSVDADTVPDTQRRRANKLNSIRHSHSV